MLALLTLVVLSAPSRPVAHLEVQRGVDSLLRCPLRPALERSLRRVGIKSRREAAVRVRVAILAGELTLTVTTPERTSLQRTLRRGSCDEVADLAAFVLERHWATVAWSGSTAMPGKDEPVRLSTPDIPLAPVRRAPPEPSPGGGPPATTTAAATDAPGSGAKPTAPPGAVSGEERPAPAGVVATASGAAAAPGGAEGASASRLGPDAESDAEDGEPLVFAARPQLAAARVHTASLTVGLAATYDGTFAPALLAELALRWRAARFSLLAQGQQPLSQPVFVQGRDRGTLSVRPYWGLLAAQACQSVGLDACVGAGGGAVLAMATTSGDLYAQREGTLAVPVVAGVARLGHAFSFGAELALLAVAYVPLGEASFTVEGTTTTYTTPAAIGTLVLQVGFGF